MTPRRPDGLTDYADLSPTHKKEAEAFCASLSTLTASDAPLFAYRITLSTLSAGPGRRRRPSTPRVSTSRKDRAPRTPANDDVILGDGDFFAAGRPML